MAYGIELRERLVGYVENGGTLVSASQIFQVSVDTIRRWLKLKKERGSLECRPYLGGARPKISKEDFCAYVESHPDLTLAEYGAHFGFTKDGAFYNMKKYGYRNKKNTYVRRTK